MGFSGFEEERVEPQPWALEGAGDVAFAVLWATGTDTALDGVFRLEALRRVPFGSPARAEAPALPRLRQ